MATEKRLIDANKLAENWFYTNDTGTKVVELLEIEQAPTVDSVEVVRCKDCRFYEKETVSCSFVTADANWYEEDFCSYGERRKDE